MTGLTTDIQIHLIGAFTIAGMEHERIMEKERIEEERQRERRRDERRDQEMCLERERLALERQEAQANSKMMSTMIMALLAKMSKD